MPHDGVIYQRRGGEFLVNTEYYDFQGPADVAGLTNGGFDALAPGATATDSFTYTVTKADTNDVLSTTFDGEILDGLGGDDTLTSRHRQTTLIGGDGQDTLTTTLAFNYGNYQPSGSTNLRNQQFGGLGNDQLRANLVLSGRDGVGGGSTDLALFGEDGDDTIEIRSLAGPGSRHPIDVGNYADGGLGNDVIVASAMIETGDVPAATFLNTAANVIWAGDGNDRITAYASSKSLSSNGEGPSGLARNSIYGEDGNDVIDATAHAANARGGVTENYLYGYGGDDRITATSIADSDFVTTFVRHGLYGMEGNDTIESYIVPGRRSAYLNADQISLHGGDGHDRIVASADASSSWARVIQKLDGQNGNDVLTAQIGAQLAPTDPHLNNETYGYRFNQLSGGLGDDVLDATVNLSTVKAPRGTTNNTLDGGDGNDVLKSGITLSTPELDRISNLINDTRGGVGNDFIEMRIKLTFSGDQAHYNPGPSLLQNKADGGTGDDTIFASIETVASPGLTPPSGSSLLSGGDGRDRLTVSGGSDNVLDGGLDDYELLGGGGADTLIGGAGDDLRVEAAEPTSSLSTSVRAATSSRISSLVKTVSSF